ncbi:MAG: GNAT family N-acetyltransferase [Bacteroidales bacterium]|nr:GNAT family N-acetyltransferase [Bacteroidales bacterium]
MIIRNATISEIDDIMEIYHYASKFMIETGNPNQWVNGYPAKEKIVNEILSKHCYVVEENSKACAVFSFNIGKDPTYSVITEGQWLNENKYGVIHRLASNGKIRGVADKCIEWCFSKIDNIRVDTHPDNKIMQKIFKRNGFIECGHITTENGSGRIAYQKYLK